MGSQFAQFAAVIIFVRQEKYVIFLFNKYLFTINIKMKEYTVILVEEVTQYSLQLVTVCVICRYL